MYIDIYIYRHIIYVSVQCVCAYVCAPAGHPSMKFRTRHNWCPFLIQILVLKQPTAFQHGSKWPYISMIVVVAALLCNWIEGQLISQLNVGWLADCWSHIVCFLLAKYMGLFECLKIEYNPKPMACRQFPIHVGSFWEYTPRSDAPISVVLLSHIHSYSLFQLSFFGECTQLIASPDVFGAAGEREEMYSLSLP